MKQIKSFILIACIAVVGMFTTNLNAQEASSKVCHIASQELVKQMPEYKAAQNQIKQLATTYQTEFRGMEEELLKIQKQYQAEAEQQTDEENMRRVKDLEAKERKIIEYQQKVSKELQEKEESLLRPIYEKARNAVFKVARAKGFDYVLDSTVGGGVILADGYDLINDVKKELGI